MTNRRHLLGLTGAAALGLVGCASTPATNRAKVVVVGGGFGGATAARYVRQLSNQQIDVTLVEPQTSFVSCPLSNMVLGGSRSLADLTLPYDTLRANSGVRVVHDRMVRLDPQGKQIALASGAIVGYDKLIVSPGVDLMLDSLPGLANAHAAGQALHAWKAGQETAALRRQLEALPDGGVFVITVPEMPYRCPPAPYERACLVAEYFKQHKPRSKVLVLDANKDVVAKGALFKKAWSERYAGIVEYVPQQRVLAVDGGRSTLELQGQKTLRADVLNVVPAMRAGRLAMDAGLVPADARWAPVDYLSFESTLVKDVHVIGDAIVSPPAMPKSGHIANNQGKVVAAAVIAQLNGWEVNATPVLMNACYSAVSAKAAIHLANVYQYSAADKTFKGTMPGPGGLSAQASELEGVYLWDWARATWADTLA